MNISDLNIDLKNLTKNEKRIADYVSKNTSRIAYMTIEEIAKELHVSTATISRFWKSIGYDNFKSFKNYLKSSVYTNSPADKMKDIIDRVDDKDILQEMIDLVARNLNKTSQNISRQVLQQIVDKIIVSRVIYIYAPGPTECLSSLLSFRLNRLDFIVKKMPPSGHELLECLINMGPNDVVFLFNFSCVLPEHRVILMHAKKIGFTSILVTDLYLSDLIEMSSYVLTVERGEVWEFHSMVTPILLIEALVVSIALRNEEQSIAKLDYLNELRKTYKKYLPR